jgi:hypothetical protein
MNFDRTQTFVLYIFILISIILILILMNHTPSSGNADAKMDTGISLEDTTLDPDHTDMSHVSTVDRRTDRPCEDCHSEFYPFELDVEQPSRIQPDESFEYRIIVKNSDMDKEHAVTDLTATLTGIGAEPKEPYNNEQSGSIRRFGLETYNFPVEAGASTVQIRASGNSGIGGLNDIDLRLTGPTGREWSSTSGGASEEINLEYQDILDGGFGDYLIEINYVSGLGAISYSLSISVEYTGTELQQTGADLQPGDEHEFSWTLVLTADEIERLGGTVSGTVEYDHGEGEMESYRYQLDISSDLVISSSGSAGIDPNLKFGRYIGLFSLLIFIGVFITRYSESSRKSLAGLLKIKNPRRIHCYFAASILFIALIHASLLLISNYSITSTPSIIGSFAFILFLAMSVEGFNREKIISRIGKPRWKVLHLGLAFLITLIVLYHALVYGAHFFG